MFMASSRVIASRSPRNSDLPRDSQTSSINVHSDRATRGLGHMNMDEIFRNIYPDSASFDNGNGEAAGGGVFSAADGGVRNGHGEKMAEVWRDITIGDGGGVEPAMTLEDYLAKAVNEEEVRVPAVVTMPPLPPAAAVGGLGMEGVMMSPAPGVQFAPSVIGEEFGSGSGGGGGRGKRRTAVEEAPLDKSTQQKQRRMIKNRESAARSRERKQAYTVELESLTTQLEEENSRLLSEEVIFCIYFCQKYTFSKLLTNLSFAGSISQAEIQTAEGEHNSGGREAKASTSSEKNAFPMSDDDESRWWSSSNAAMDVLAQLYMDIIYPTGLVVYVLQGEVLN